MTITVPQFETASIASGGEEAAQEHYKEKRQIRLYDTSPNLASTYGSDYGRKRPERNPDFRREEFWGPLGGRTGPSEYGACFKNFQPKRNIRKPVEMEPKRPSKFHGETTSGADYTWKSPQQRAQYDFLQREEMAATPFATRSLYQDSYVPMKTPLRKPRPKSSVGPSKAKFYGESTVMADFKGWPGAKPAEPLLRLHELNRPPPDTKFSSETTSGDYKKWNLGSRRVTLGVQVGVNGVFHSMIDRTRSLPAVARQVFTTVHDGERSMCFLFKARDNNSTAVGAKNTTLGQVDLNNIPDLPKGKVRVEVIMRLDPGNNLSVTINDLSDRSNRKTWKGSASSASGIPPFVPKKGWC